MTFVEIETTEQRRLVMQDRLDRVKTQVERNQLGQFATPTALARDILQYAKRILAGRQNIRFLDPAFGTGSFYSAFLKTFGESINHCAVGFEIDPHYGNTAREFWKYYPLKIRLEDFTKATVPVEDESKATLLICNPPYVRHHHIQSAEKKRLHSTISKHYGISLSGLSGLYCYFLCLSKEWMAPGALAAWLIPSEFMDVNYGEAVKHFLLQHVSLIHVHRFLPEDVQFGDALVSSAVVWIRNEKPVTGQKVKFTLGGSLDAPSLTNAYMMDELWSEKKWKNLSKIEKHTNFQKGCSLPSIGEFFEVKRGIATGANEFFVLSSSEIERYEIPLEFLTPILPSPRYLKDDLIRSDDDGVPIIDKCNFVFSTDFPEEYIQEKYPKVWIYLQHGIDLGISKRYICRNRIPWYAQEKRTPAPFLCTYMGRFNGKNGRKDLRPFRFILNQSSAIAANVYLMLYPKPWLERLLEGNPALIEEIWQALRSIPIEALVKEGRVYGGGLHKLEPKELMSAPLEELSDLFSRCASPQYQQLTFF